MDRISAHLEHASQVHELGTRWSSLGALEAAPGEAGILEGVHNTHSEHEPAIYETLPDGKGGCLCPL